jgi:hypothetical protein
LNLADPAVLERLNSVLERYPSLVLTEHDNSVIHAPHEDFRIFATLNPVDDYVGRQAMSPAYRDRWQGYRHVPRAGEAEYAALARLAIHGEQPAINLGSDYYDGSTEPACLGRLAKIKGIDNFLAAFARFQVSVEAAADASDGGTSRLAAERREPYVFTRRGFFNTLELIERDLDAAPRKRQVAQSAWCAIDRYFLNKIAGTADKTAVIELAHAVGLNEQGWSKST